MNYKPNAVKVTLDNGKSFIVQTVSTCTVMARLRTLGKVSPSGNEVAYTAKVYYDFSAEVTQ